MTKMLIILHDLNNGGVERVLSVLANYFAEHNYLVHILAIATDKVSYPISNKIKYEYIPLLRLYKKTNVLKDFKIMFRIFKEIKRINPDVVLGFEDSIIIRSVPSAWFLRKKIIVSERTDPSVYGTLMRIVRQIAFDMADHVVFQTEDAQKFFPKRTQNKSAIIFNPISENLPLRSHNINKDILMACRLRDQKNVALAIKAFAKFYVNHRDYRLVIYGEGELLGELQKLTKELGVEKSVFFPGHIDNIYEKMSECAMYLSTSNYEGLSNSMIEALAIGVPSICTDCPVGGARMIIENNVNGILVPVKDENAVSQAMAKIADNNDFALMLSNNSMEIKEKLSVDTVCPQWEKLVL